MNAAEKIMKKKAALKAELDRALPKARSDALWREATEKLDGLLARYSALPKGEHIHTDSRILPSAAVYLTVKEAVGPEKAYRIIEDAAVRGCAEIEKKLRRLMVLSSGKNAFTGCGETQIQSLFSDRLSAMIRIQARAAGKRAFSREGKTLAGHSECQTFFE